MKIRWCFAFLLVYSLAHRANAASALEQAAALNEAKTVQVALLSDGESERSQSEVELLKRMIREELAGRYEVRFPDELHETGDWTRSGIQLGLDRLLARSDVDVCIAMDAVGSHLVCQLDGLPFPVLATGVIDAGLQGLQQDVGGSIDSKLNYLSGRVRLKRDLERFSELLDFHSVGLLVEPAFVEAMPDLIDGLISDFETAGKSVRVVEVDANLKSSLERLGDEVDSIFILPVARLDAAAVELLAETLIQNQLPAFGLVDGASVDAGVLASMASMQANQARLSQAATLAARMIEGEFAQPLSTRLRTVDQLSINERTAALLGIRLRFEVLSEAKLVGAEQAEPELEWSLSLVMNEALSLDLNLQAADQELLAGQENLSQARSQFLPQVDLSASWSMIDENQASLGRAERTLSGSVRGSQVLYAESLWAQIDVERDLQSARVSDVDVQRLDVVQTAAQAYLNVLRAKSLARIQSEDLQLSRSNLELAEVLYEIGSSGPADVYRWQSRIATGRRDVLNARANVQIAEIELNRVLRRPLEQAVSIQEFESDESGQLVDARLEQYVDNSTGYMLFRDFQVADAFQSSPELASLDGAIRAQSRLLISARRAHWQPVLSLDGSLTDVFETGGAGSQDLGAFSSFIPNPESTIWSAALVGSFPLFTGGAKRSRERRARHELVRLRFQRDALTQLVEQRIRAALQLAVASFAGIRLSSQAATAAEKGLALVTDAYSSGLGSIVEVLEAQTAAVVARESAVAARFDFAVDMIGVQRAVGHFNLFQTGTSRDRWFDKLKDFEFIRGARTGR